MLYGVPYGKDTTNLASYDIFMRAMERNHPDLVFLQMAPENFLVRQRFLSQKSALKKVEDYDPKSIPYLNPQTPFSWEELVVNPAVFDMILENKVYSEIDLKQSMLTYSFPALSDKKNGGMILRDKYITAITEQIVGKQFSDFAMINKALYQSLMGKHKVMLTEMPEILFRQIIANNLSLDQLKDIFKFAVESTSQLTTPVSLREAAFNFLPHVFQSPKDLYMTALLKESFQAATCIVGFVGKHHVDPVRRSWIPPPHGINLTEATRIPERDFRETNEEILEKHALLDSLLEKRPWGQSYIHNPFPYLFEDITKESETGVSKLVETFRFYYQKYELFKKEMQFKWEIPDFKDRKLQLLTNQYYIKEPEKEVKDMEIMVKLLSTSHGENIKKIELKVNIFRQSQLKE